MSNCPILISHWLVAPRHRPVKSAVLATVLTCMVMVCAYADAVTYTGTVGGQAIVLELTEAEDGPLIGRYSYLGIGADIPLHPLYSTQYDAVLAEELQCTPALCVRPDGNLVLDPPLGGHLNLKYDAQGTKLSGTWSAPTTDGAELPVELTRFGSRAYALDDAFAYGSFLWMNYNDALISTDTSPYDFAKMQVPLAEGPLQTLNGATYREVTDPRTKFAFPRIVSLPGGGDIAGVNAMLDQQRWAINFAGFECLGMAYRSSGWMPKPFGDDDDQLSNIAKEQTAIDYLTDAVITTRQSGRLSCGGQSGESYVEYHTYDVRAGSALNLGDIFKDWDASTNRPPRALIDWVIDAYR